MHMQALKVDAALPMTADHAQERSHIYGIFCTAAEMLPSCTHACHEDRCLAQANVVIYMCQWFQTNHHVHDCACDILCLSGLCRTLRAHSLGRFRRVCIEWHKRNFNLGLIDEKALALSDLPMVLQHG